MTTQANETVYAAGWRQGTVLGADIDVVSTVRSAVGVRGESRATHSIWALVTQDCNLFRMRSNVNTPVVELRQVHDSDPPAHGGIHARKFLLDAKLGHYLIDDKPSAFVSPRFLCDAALAERQYTLDDSRVLALKTWLGNRYDRPAVPDELVPLARAIAEAIKGGEDENLSALVRDVYMRFEEADESVRFSLYAVIGDHGDPDKVREWLASCALEIPIALGVASEIQALTAAQISFATIETTYCADLSQLTWMGEESTGQP